MKDGLVVRREGSFGAADAVRSSGRDRSFRRQRTDLHATISLSQAWKNHLLPWLPDVYIDSR